MKYFTALRTAWAVFGAIRKRKRKRRQQQRLYDYEYEAQVLYAELKAIAAGDPKPTTGRS